MQYISLLYNVDVLASLSKWLERLSYNTNINLKQHIENSYDPFANVGNNSNLYDNTNNTISNIKTETLNLLGDLSRILQCKSSSVSIHNTTEPYAKTIKTTVTEISHQLITNISNMTNTPPLYGSEFQPIFCETPHHITSHLICLPINCSIPYLYEFVQGTNTHFLFIQYLDEKLNLFLPSINNNPITMKTSSLFWCDTNVDAPFKNIVCMGSYFQTNFILDCIGWLVDKYNNNTSWFMNSLTPDQLYTLCTNQWSEFIQAVDYFFNIYFNHSKGSPNIYLNLDVVTTRMYNQIVSYSSSDVDDFTESWKYECIYNINTIPNNPKYIAKVNKFTSEIKVLNKDIDITRNMNLVGLENFRLVNVNDDVECTISVLNFWSITHKLWCSSGNQYFKETLFSTTGCEIEWSIDKIDKTNSIINTFHQGQLVTGENVDNHFALYQSIKITGKYKNVVLCITALYKWFAIMGDLLSHNSNNKNSVSTFSQYNVLKLIDDIGILHMKNIQESGETHYWQLPMRFIDVYYYKNFQPNLEQCGIAHILYKKCIVDKLITYEQNKSPTFKLNGVNNNLDGYFTAIFYIPLHSSIYHHLSRDNFEMIRTWIQQGVIEQGKLKPPNNNKSNTMSASVNSKYTTLSLISSSLTKLQEMCLFISKFCQDFECNTSMVKESIVANHKRKFSSINTVNLSPPRITIPRQVDDFSNHYSSNQPMSFNNNITFAHHDINNNKNQYSLTNPANNITTDNNKINPLKKPRF